MTQISSKIDLGTKFLIYYSNILWPNFLAIKLSITKGQVITVNQPNPKKEISNLDEIYPKKVKTIKFTS